jgi:peptidoglycan/xylan/chitin deacetylase (PgdA/CDA1 family)
MHAAGHLVATFHYVRPRNCEGVTGLTPAEFASRCRWIASRYEVVTAAEFAARRGSSRGLALITFDDAVKDQHRYAAPILAELKLPAVFFAPMRPVSGEADGWCTQHLLHALASVLGFDELSARVDAALRAIGVEPKIDAAKMNALYHYEQPRKRRLKYLMAFVLPEATARAVLTSINRTVGLRHGDWFMSVRELRELRDAGHTIGAHGFDHIAYTTVDHEARRRDMSRASAVLTELFGPGYRPISFPFGRADGATRRLAAEHGHGLMFAAGERVDARDVPGEGAKAWLEAA